MVAQSVSASVSGGIFYVTFYSEPNCAKSPFGGQNYPGNNCWSYYGSCNEK